MGGWESRPIILHVNFQSVASTRSAETDLASGRTPRNTVPDRVLHNRLQDHLRNSGIENSWIRRDFNTKTILKMDLFDGEIQLQVLEFAAKRYLLGRYFVEDTSQEIAEASEHLLGLRTPLLAHQHHDGVQGIEQKMRLKLHL